MSRTVAGQGGGRGKVGGGGKGRGQDEGETPAAPLAGRRVLVIGGGGFIGRHVLARLHGAGATLAVMDVAGPPPGIGNIDWITGSVGDTALVASCVAGASAVVFLANSSLPGSAQADLATEVAGHVAVTIKVAEICDRQGVGRFVFASSGGTVYGFDPGPGARLHEDARTRPLNAYGVSKLAIEHYLRILDSTRDMGTVSLRISNPYGPGQRAVRAQGVVAAAMQHAFEGTRMSIWGDGSVERDFIHVGDVAEAFLAAVLYGGGEQVFNIGSGRAVSLRAVIAGVEAAMGRPIRQGYETGRPIDVARNVLDIGRARAEFGWQPRITLVDGLARTAAWWQQGRPDLGLDPGFHPDGQGGAGPVAG